MLRIGVTGGIASGKSTVCACFVSHYHIPLIDTDRIAHRLTALGQPLLTTIAERFGNEILNNDGTLNRHTLRKRVFNDPAALCKLEAIMHPAIRSEVQIQLNGCQTDYVLIAIPLLIEKNWQQEVDRILVIDLPETQQRERALARNPELAPQELAAIMARQATREQRLSAADDIIDNSGDSSRLEAQVKQLHRRYRQLAKASNEENITWQP